MNTASINLFASSLKNSGEISKKTDSLSAMTNNFSGVLNQSISARNSNDSKKTPTKVMEEVPAKSNVKQQNSKDNTASKVEDDKETNEIETSDTKKQTEVVYSDDLIALLSQLVGTMEEFLNVCAEQLGITKEQLQEALESLGLTTMDLLNGDNLKHIFLEVKGVDASELLTNESLVNELNNWMQIVEEMNPIKDLPLTQDDVAEAMEFLKLMNQGYEEEIKPANVMNDEQNFNSASEEPKDMVSQQVVHTNSDTKETTSQDFTKQEKSNDKDMKSEIPIVVNNSNDITAQTKVQFFDQLASTTQAKEIVDQLVQQIKVNISTESTSMEMVLTPETLGTVHLTVTAKDGVMTAQMITETQETKQAIESQIQVLKDTLQEQGLKVEAVEVTVAANNFNFMNQSQMNQRDQENNQQVEKTSGKLRVVSDDEGELDAEEVTKSNVNASIGKGTQIDLMA